MTTKQNLEKSDNGARVKAIANLPAKQSRPDPLRWVVLAVFAYVFVVLANFLMNEAWKWSLVLDHLFSERIVLAVWNSVWLAFLSTVIGLVIGFFTCMARLSSSRILRSFAITYIWITRATPALMLILIVYFLGALTPTLGLGLPFVPNFFEWPTNDVINQFTAAVASLAIYVGGKSAEIFRSGYSSVEQGQHEALLALGMRPTVGLRFVVAPQAIRIVIPPLANEIVTMFKSTSLVVVIGYAELLTTVQRLYAINFETIPMLAVACIWYLVLTSFLMVGQMFLEKRFSRGYTSGARSV